MNKKFDVIIIGGSFAGLQAAMTLGRSLRQVLVIDGGKPCNRQTPHSHNFITHDGETPASISAKAKEQALQYKTVQYSRDIVTSATKVDKEFQVVTESGENYIADKLLFSSGVKDIMPAIPGFAESWGISVLHCVYCHGYEVRDKPLGILANGPEAFEFYKMVANLSKKPVIFTNGPSTIPPELKAQIENDGGSIVEKEVAKIEHEGGYIKHLVFADGSEHSLTALFARPAFEQNTTAPQSLGCAITNQGYVQVDAFQKTTVDGIYAAGDCTTMMRAVSYAVSAGMVAGAMINRDLVNERFKAAL